MAFRLTISVRFVIVFKAIELWPASRRETFIRFSLGREMLFFPLCTHIVNMNCNRPREEKKKHRITTSILTQRKRKKRQRKTLVLHSIYLAEYRRTDRVRSMALVWFSWALFDCTKNQTWIPRFESIFHWIIRLNLNNFHLLCTQQLANYKKNCFMSSCRKNCFGSPIQQSAIVYD